MNGSNTSPFDITPKLLLVFQNSNIGWNVGRIISRYGCIVEVANNGPEALKMLSWNFPYDLLITEMFIDEVSGFSLAEIATGTPDTRTIAINNGGEETRIIAVETGADSVLDSPVEIDLLLDTAAMLLRDQAI